jgi:hypothetical protein
MTRRWKRTAMRLPNYKDLATARYPERGATSVEYAVIVVAIILAIIATVLFLVNPADPGNSLLPKTYNSVSGKIGNYATFPSPPE